jgi:hypothetical protein
MTEQTFATCYTEANISEYEFNQMLAETVHRIGIDRVHRCMETLARKYGWPIPSDKRFVVATAVAMLVKGEEAARRQ